MKTDLFRSCGHCWVFQISWHFECSSFTASSFKIWNSSTRIPSPPLALFIVMLPKAHLTSHSRMSGSRWVITPSWLSGSWRSFLYSSVYSCLLLQDGGGIGWGDHFLPPKFIKRSFECWATSTKQLLNTGRGYQIPRKAPHSLQKEVGQNIKDKKKREMS